MTTSPTHSQVLQLVNTGFLFFYVHDDGTTWFCLSDESAEMSGRLLIRPDWNEGPDDRPGLMPVIQMFKDEKTGFYAEGHEPAIDRLSVIYKALRERLSSAKVFYLDEGRWMLTSSGSPPEHS